MGFRANRSTIHITIHIIREIFEKCYEFGKELLNIFIDFKMAFDKLNRQSILDYLSVLGIPQKLIRLIKITMEGPRARVKIGSDLSDPFEVRNGVRQRDVLSPLLFSLTLEAAVRHLDMRSNISTKPKQLYAYADDIITVSRTKNPWKKHILY
jgi:hypothetical protein